MSETQMGYIGSIITGRRIHDIFLLTVLAIVLERSITVLFWSYESNPVVLHLGVESWIAVTAVLVGVLWFGWYYLELYHHRIFRIWYLGIASLHTLAAAANLVVISL